MSIIRSHVDRLFEDAESPLRRVIKNPVTGEFWVANCYPSGPEKRDACRALLAKEWFFHYGPPDAPPLPLSDLEIECLKYVGDFAYIVACFAESLRANDWDFNRHPSFEEYVRGVLAASEFGKGTVLRRRYPPRHLRGLGPGQIWQPDH